VPTTPCRSGWQGVVRSFGIVAPHTFLTAQAAKDLGASKTGLRNWFVRADGDSGRSDY
jgi:hypothetical protein